MTPLATSAPGVKAKAFTMNVRERSRDWLTPLNLHYAGLAVVLLVNVYLLIQMGILWRQVKDQDADAMASQQVALKTAEIQARPLEGLDVKLARASGEADRFYADRLPVSYSEVLSELGVLTKRQGVRLTHVNYAQAAVAAQGVSQLTEVRMDASLTGDYRSLVLFLNGLERDHVFFVSNGVTLTGQQTGTVNLRIRLTTYLRGLGPGEVQAAAVDNSPSAALDKDLDAQAAKAAAAQAGGPQ